MRIAAVARYTLLGALLACLAGCVYHHQKTDLSYMFNMHYNVFAIDELPDFSFTNFVGYCMLPMQRPDDISAQEALVLIEKFISENHYLKVNQNEMIASDVVAKRTFLVAFGYKEKFTDGSVEVSLDLHAIDPATKLDTIFWAWRATYEEYPMSAKTLEPALRDIFTKEPIDYARTDRLFPQLCAKTNDYREFVLELERARAGAAK